MKKKPQKTVPHPLLSFEEHGTQLVLGLGQAPPHVGTGVLNGGSAPMGLRTGSSGLRRTDSSGTERRYTWSP